MKDSYWIQKADSLCFKQLDVDLESDVVIIGAGITGLMLGYYLTNSEKDFVILEADEVGRGASGRSTGKITSQHSLIYNYLSRKFNDEVARFYYDANEEAIESIDGIITKHHINCDFKRVDSIVYSENNENDIKEEYETCLRLKIPCELIEEAKDPIPFKQGLSFFYQAQFNPLLFLQGLAETIDLQGYEIFENSPVKEIKKTEDGYEVFCNNQIVKAKQVVLATQFPFIDEGQLYFSKLFHEASTLYCAPSENPFVNQWIAHDENVKSFRSFQEQGQDYILMGGEHHPVGRKKKESHFIEVCKNQFCFEEPLEKWTSQDYLSADRLPLIGPLVQEDHNLLFASGYQKWGNTLGCVAAKLLCAQILKQESQYTSLFDPHRDGLLLNFTSIKENFNVAKELVKSKFQSVQYVMPRREEGALVNIDGDVYGVYVDSEGEAHILDVKCTHMGCTCVFNEVDKTWDCPCHGSRFNIDGEIIRGPASTPLQKIAGTNKMNPHIIMHKEKK